MRKFCNVENLYNGSWTHFALWLVSNYQKSFARIQVGRARDGILHKLFLLFRASWNSNEQVFLSFWFWHSGTMETNLNGKSFNCAQYFGFPWQLLRIYSRLAYVKSVNRRPVPIHDTVIISLHFRFPFGTRFVSNQTLEHSETEAIVFEIKNWWIKMTSWGGLVNRQIRQTSEKWLCVEAEQPRIRYAISYLICDWMKENNKLRFADVLWVRNENWSNSATCVTWISVPQHFKGADERNLYPLPSYFACKECNALFSYSLRTAQPKTIMFFLRSSYSYTIGTED